MEKIKHIRGGMNTCGGSGKRLLEEGKGNVIESAIQGGTLGRDQVVKKPKVLLKDGKVQPGTKAYALQ